MKKIVALTALSTAIILPTVAYADNDNNNNNNTDVHIEFNSMASNNIQIGEKGSYRLFSPESIAMSLGAPESMGFAGLGI